MNLAVGSSWRRCASVLAGVSASLLCAATFTGSAHAASSIFGTTGTNPWGIAVDSAGNIYTANSGSDNVSKITPAGVSTTNWAATGSSPFGIAVDSAGNIYTANNGSNNVSKVTPSLTLPRLPGLRRLPRFSAAPGARLQRSRLQPIRCQQQTVHHRRTPSPRFRTLPSTAPPLSS